MSDEISKAFEKSFKLSAQKAAELDRKEAQLRATNQSLIKQHIPRFESLISEISADFTVTGIKYDDCVQFQVEVAHDHKLEVGFFTGEGFDGFGNYGQMYFISLRECYRGFVKPLSKLDDYVSWHMGEYLLHDRRTTFSDAIQAQLELADAIGAFLGRHRS